MYDENHLAQALRAASVGDDARLFARHDGGELSYGALFAGAERMAAALAAAGVKPGDRVAAQVEKSLEAVQLYLGSVLAGAVFLPLNTAYTPAEVGYFLGDAEPAAFLCDPGRREALTGAAKNVGAVMTLDRAGRGTLRDAADAADAGFGAVPRGAEDLAAILYTSGTTGRSKGAMLSHRALTSNSLTLRDVWRFTAADVLIHALPIFHTHGLFVATNVTLMAGGGVFFMAKFDADAALGAMAQGATAMMGVPTFYTRLLDHPGLTREATAGMRLFVSGSAPLLPETHDAWRARTGHAILERYGMTETNMNTSNPYDGERRAGTVGFPLPGVDLRVADPETGRSLPQGEIGVIEVKGDNLFSGYWRMPEKTAEDMRADGFFITGDLGVIDDRGYVSIVGRAKDLIISGGFNVYPREVEERIDAVVGVKESAVVGVPHPDFGEAVVAVVTPEKPDSVDEAAVMTAISADLARYKHPKRVVIVDELPRNAMGKVQKKALRETFGRLFTDAAGA
ncbi:malonate--CoA ligase [Rubrimonas cliftonensis]|uniref:Malonyl-CoA/methylmalonyl-CoA synthetase n=1 Tax=Rubrimonas cliftonensis TaxID=89524 RepID=A0A1H3YC79_9RHOB|nr:malonyl-CoA synthase [Rubrimonas cliftonensis]SEA08661.1 malonyl-CoA/methylmalonyl-CoA synthetase [Rubrimonas cliftonensis]